MFNKSTACFIIFLGIFFFSPTKIFAQSISIPTIDMRGENPIDASIVAIKNSRKDVIVILIRGGSQILIDKTKAQLRALVHNGYDRIGVVLSDLKSSEALPVIGIVADGTAYAAIKDAKPDTITGWETYNLVRDAYQDYIIPKLKNADLQKGG